MSEKDDKTLAVVASKGRHFFSGVNALTAIVLMSLIWYMLNYLSSRHYERYDISKMQFYSLSERSHDILNQLRYPVEAYVIVPTSSKLFDHIQASITVYEAHENSNVSVQYIDPHRDLTEVQNLSQRFNLGLINNSVIFASQNKHRIVPIDDLIIKDEREPDIENVEKNVRFKFLAEQKFSGAIYDVSQGENSKVYFLSGHGEHEPSDHTAAKGYSKMAHYLSDNFINFKRLRLAERLEVPDDCDALVIAGPTRKFSQPELIAISDYLNNNGRVLMLLESFAYSGLEDILIDWGVSIGENKVIDKKFAVNSSQVSVYDYAAHPVSDKLKNIQTSFFSPCSVDLVKLEDDATDRPRGVVLINSSSNSWAEVDAETSPEVFDENKDRKGPIPIAVAIERGVGENIDVSIESTRIVIVGDADFLSNGLLSAGSLDFLSYALNWLIDNETDISIPPKVFDQISIALDKKGLDKLFFLSVLGLPSIFGLLAFLVWLRRKA